MTVRVLYFSVLRDLAGASEAEESLPPGETWTLGGLIQRLETRMPALRDWDRRLLFAVNQAWADRDRVLQDGDEIAIMPPVQGG